MEKEINLKKIPEKNKQVDVYNATIKEGESLESFISLAEKSLERGDLTSAYGYISEEFHTFDPVYRDCARIFEKIAEKYIELGDIEKAVEHLEFAISSWTKESERLESRNRSLDTCNKNINRLDNKILILQKENKING